MRIEYENFAGYEWTEQFILYLIDKYRGEADKISCIRGLELLLFKLRLIDKDHYLSKHKRHNIRREFKQRIAAHNAQFRRNPMSTVPINGYYQLDGEPFALHIKYLDGQPLINKDPEAVISESEREILIDPNLANILVDISNSVSDRQFIDLCKFMPSNQPV